mgnify:CR=1 FL=1
MPHKKVKPVIPAKKLEQYSELLSGFPDIEVKGAEMPYTSHNGNMFSFIKEDGELALRLSEEDRTKFIVKFKTQLTVRHSTILKEYVDVPETLFAKTKDLRKYMIMSIAYVKSLKSKKK